MSKNALKWQDLEDVVRVVASHLYSREVKSFTPDRDSLRMYLSLSGLSFHV